MNKHPDHGENIVVLKRIEGQIRGVMEMIRKRKYCVDILAQTRSARRALLAAEEKILKAHIENCVSEAVKSGSGRDADRKLKEILELIKKFMR